METIAILLITVALPICAVTFWIFGNKWFAWRKAEAHANAAMTAEKAAQYAAKTERLEQRVATLERILTDRSTTLSEEIEGLREKPLN
ncbi:hypothetical protein [Parasphingopyxis marina]|uniref:Phage shock protein B n=1 Tax=Parasphingopyxis marina TaxID=2761622 RepID=A0A842HYU5_9SPHN|nr:hypothetical protein [Parasphingopyxis marina]MBC2777677.1 hypothetical protein [Parasphingopyxis marina]